MTEQPDTTAIRARAEAATDGPWVYAEARSEHPRYNVTSEAPEFEDHDQDNTIADRVLDYTDAAFIAHAREDVPALCVALDEARQEIERLRAMCIPLTDLVQELDLARQNLHHARAMSDAHWKRAEVAEAERDRLAAQVERVTDYIQTSTIMPSHRADLLAILGAQGEDQP